MEKNGEIKGGFFFSSLFENLPESFLFRKVLQDLTNHNAIKKPAPFRNDLGCV